MFVGDFEEVGGFGDVIAEIGVLDEVVADVLAGAHDADEAELLTGGVVDAGVVVLAESIDIDDRPARHRGIPLNVLQKILGHKSIETTKGYLHPDLDHIAQAGGAWPTGSSTPRRRGPSGRLARGAGSRSVVPTIGACEAENRHLVPVWSRVFNLGASRRLRAANKAGTDAAA